MLAAPLQQTHPLVSRRVRWRCALWTGLCACTGLALASGCVAPTEQPAPDPPAAGRSPPTGESGPPPRFRHLTIEDGLSQNAVFGLVQDRTGFVWVGTKDGLNRYDGAAFTVYRHDPFRPATLSSSYVTALLEARSGALWVGTYDGGLNRFDPATGAVVRFAHSPRHRIVGLAEDDLGDVWLATDGGGVHRLSGADDAPAGAAFERVAHDPADPASLPSDRTTSLLAVPDGALWVGTDAGLFRRDAAGRTARFGPEHGLLDAWVSALGHAADGTLWVGSARGLSRVLPGADRFEGVPYPHHRRGVGWSASQTIRDAGDGRLWLATSDGLARFDPATRTYAWSHSAASDPESVGANGLSQVLVDRSGVVWVGSNGFGLSLYDPKTARFRTLRHRPAPGSRESGFSVRALHEDARGGLWIGAGVLYHRDAATGAVRSFETGTERPEAFGNASVLAITADRAGVLWFATIEGLFRHDSATGHTRRYAHDPARTDGLPGKVVFDVFEDRRGAVWAVTRHHLARLDDPEAGRFTRVLHTPEAVGLSDEPLYPSVHEDAAGAFWMGTHAGLLRLDPRTGARRHFRTDPADPASLSHDHVRAILPDPRAPEAVLWVATAGGGLNRLDVAAGTFTHVTTRDGLPNDVVYSVLPDRAGRLWLSTNRGIARYDPRSGEVRTYDVHDGLQSNEFNGGAWHQTPDGRIAVGGLYGVTQFDPETLTDNPHVPPVVLTGLAVGGRAVAAGDASGLLAREPWATGALRLSHRENMVTFTFAALDFSAPARNRYAYRMEGFDAGWIEAGTQRSATYTNLPPGRYKFRVRGTNNDGLWSAPMALAVRVAPPWWRAAWAVVLYALLGLGLAAGAYRARQREVTRAHEREIERIEAQQLREIDRARSAFFANVSHEVRTPLTLTLGPLADVLAGDYGPLPEAAREPIGLARRSAQRVLGLVDQILDVARLEAGATRLRAQPLDLAAVARAHLEAFAPLAAHRRIAAEWRGGPPAEGLWADPEHVGTILANLLSNAVKFTPEGGRVCVGTETDAAEARVWVEDTGPGLPPDELTRVFERFHQVEGAQRPLGTGLGLALAHDLARLHGGRLAAENVPGAGCRFTLTLPLGTAHLAPEQIVPEPAPPAEPRPVLADALDAAAPVPPEPDDDDRTTVLVADDNADVRAYLRRHLARAGYRVEEAADGQAALDRVRERLPDLVVSDVMMPRLDGLGLCRALRADAATDFVPVLLLTARAAPEDRLDGLAELCDDYLAKPFDVRELVARVGNLIALRRRLRDRYTVVRAGTSQAVLSGEPSGDGQTGAAPAAPTGLAPADARLLAAVRDAIDAHLGDEGFGVDALAVAVGLSRGHLHRRLTALGQPSPSDLLRATRLEHADRMLRARAGTVSEVAYAVGYRSVAHFSNAFLAHTGRRPSAAAAEPAA